MHPFRPRAAALALGLALSLVPAAAGARTFTFEYHVVIGPVAAGRGPIHVFLPLAQETAQQRVLSEQVRADLPGRVETETRHGNRFWHGSLARSSGKALAVTITTRVERTALHRDPPPDDADPQPIPAKLSRYLAPDSRVVVGDPILDPILKEIRAAAGPGATPRKARAIYDWVVDNVTYKKVGTGWGNGDTFWACNERYGNCTDFHALFISLARTEGLPARFEIGFPVPEEPPSGEIPGYHCWVQMWEPGVGWFPIDASEASKHKEKRDLFYGTQPADRIHMSSGRDLVLSPDQKSGPLNYFVYPLVEVGGKRFQGPVEKSFRYREG